MARTHRTDYVRSNRSRTLPLPDVAPVADAAGRLLAATDATSRRVFGQQVLAELARQTGVTTPELVVPDDPQPHRRSGGKIVFSQQGEYRRRKPSRDDPTVARGGKALGRIRMHNRTPARGAPVRGDAFLHTLLHEFCHHHDTEALDIHESFHTAGFFARIRHLRGQIEAGCRPSGSARPASAGAPPIRRSAPRRKAGVAAQARPFKVPPGLERLWSIIRNL